MLRLRQVRLLALALSVLFWSAASASAGSITTLFNSNNNGSPGGAVYFDVSIGANPLLISGFDLNTASTDPFLLDVYTVAGGSAGHEGTAGDWTLVATGSGTGAGLNSPSSVLLNSSFLLDASTTYGMALVLSTDAEHRYTNGTGSNQVYSNADLTLTLGGASNAPFTPPLFTPRVWNGTVYYDLASSAVPEPASLLLLATGLGTVGARRRLKKRA